LASKNNIDIKKADVKKLYHETITKRIISNQPVTNMSKINKLLVSKKREQQKAELEDSLRKERHHRAAWREAFVPAYFESEWGRAYLAHRELMNGGAHVMSQDILAVSVDENRNKESTTNATSSNNNNTNNFLQMSENDFANDENIQPMNEKFDSETNNANKSSIDDLSSTRFAGLDLFIFKKRKE
jgi:hypothetical protein